jgi:hypothetical protein
MVDIDIQSVSEFLGCEPISMPPSSAVRFEVVRGNHILNLQLDPEAMTAHIEIFGKDGGLPLTSIALDYCEKVAVRNDNLEFEITRHCDECSSMKSEFYSVSVTPQIKVIKL